MPNYAPLLITAIIATAPLQAGNSGADLFADNCASCHGPDGKARTPAGRKFGAKDLSLSKLSDAEIEKQIRDGAKNERGADKMPAFRDKLSSSDISTLVSFVKTFRR